MPEAQAQRSLQAWTAWQMPAVGGPGQRAARVRRGSGSAAGGSPGESLRLHLAAGVRPGHVLWQETVWEQVSVLR